MSAQTATKRSMSLDDILSFRAMTTTALSPDGKWFAYLYPGDDKHVKAAGPVSPYCDCPVCSRYSLAYLHHLFKLNDSLYFRLATMHNLRFMTMLMERLRVVGQYTSGSVDQ